MKCIYTLLCLLLIVQAQATVRRVRAGNTSPGNGSSWSAAYTDLQAAINASANGDEVWVAVPIGSARYQPASGISYNMKDGVKIYGGFAGNETVSGSRNWQTNVTTLQGNANSVVSCDNNASSSAVLDGFTITGGNNFFGGGINTNNASATFSNLIITNNYASNSGGGFYTFGSPTLTNVVIRYNTCGTSGTTDERGGGLYIDQGNPTVINCIFDHNYAHRDGGGVYAYEVSYTNILKPTFVNCLFSNNESGAGAGGAVFGEATSFIFTNCTFYGNTCYLTGCAGGIHNYGNSSSGATSNTIIKNCLFWGNFVSYNGVQSDLYNTPSYATATTTYSMLVSPPSGTGNVAPSGTLPFVNPSSPAGPDNLWFTADDGYRLIFCNPAVIDKGDNSAISLTTDLSGNSRKFDVPLITDGGAGAAPIVDLGAYENQTGTTATQLTGSIGNAHTVPNPQELVPDFITSTGSPLSGTSVRWQKSEDNGSSWAAANVVSPADSAGYRLPPLTTNTWYRRVVTSTAYCNTDYYSNIVLIKVVTPNGAITGKVVSNAGTAVKGITITAQRLGGAISGSPANYTYTTVTGDDGTYSLSPVYYGDPSVANTSATFRVTPSKVGHGFNFLYLDKTLTQNIPQQQNVNFTDTTVFSITGRTVQQCINCNDISGGTVSQTCPLDGITIYKNNSFATTTGFIDTAYGRYALSVSDPATIRIEPRFTGHVFSPAFLNVPVTDNVAVQDFRDTTVHTISGKLSDGCGNYIGGATLVFTDILPNAANGNPRTSCFRKEVTTNAGSGTYSITLPARRYSVTVKSFTPLGAVGSDTYLFPTDVTDFFNNRLPKDSLKRDITNVDTVLNLKYIRLPVLSLLPSTGLDTLCNGTNRGYAIFQQGIVDSFKIKVYQGPASIGCALTDTTNKIRVYTSIQADDNTNQQYNLNPADIVTIRLKGGTPNIIAPYYKTLNIQYTDVYNRTNGTTSFNKNIIVTGVKSDVATFLTVSPQIPLLVLHDPPGDNSYSYWQSNQTIQSAFRMFTSKSNSTNLWAEVKIGTDIETGIGVSTESKVWGTISGGLNISSANTTSNETILTTTTSQSFATSSSPTVVDGDGDLYIGAALNIIYAGATEIKKTGCQIVSNRNIIMADSGFATQYVYTEAHIRNDIIPALIATAQSTSLTQKRRDSIMNQVHVWQQVLDNNAANKARAVFDKNISFDGSAGAITAQTTTSVSKTSSIEFSMSIDATLAAQLGFEVAGSGVSGGIDLNFRTETGGSTASNTIQETTTGYVLDDDDNGDYFSVNIKKDPVYSTPLFELAAGTASCPPEPGAQPRDEVQLRVPVPAISGIAANTSAQFVLYLGNTSQSQETRTYLLSFDQSSNPNGANVTIGGSPVLTPISYTIGYGGEVQVTVTVSKPSSSTVFSFEGLKFNLTDGCTGDIVKSALIAAYFVSPCSSVTLGQPENGWTLTSAANNILPVLIRDYTVSGLTSVVLEYSPAGTSNWVTGFTQTAAQLNPDGANGTIVNWNVSGLADTAYNLRLKLVCAQGVAYSQRASGFIDRQPPVLFGRPTPTNDVYVDGNVISFSYNENLSLRTDSIRVTMRRLSTDTLIPVTVTSYQNKIVIVPNNSISRYVGDSIRIIVNRVADQYGNVKTIPDTIRFVVGVSTTSTGTNALTVSMTNPMIYKNGDSTMNVFFRLPVNATHDTRVNYTVGGTARLGIDYTIVYTTSQPGYAFFNGAQGAIRIPNGANQAVLKIVPVSDTSLTANKTVIINISEGGDYALGVTTAVSGTIVSGDTLTSYTFIGDGNFNVKTNWLNSRMPLTTLTSGKTIFINPSGTCILNVPVTIKPGATLRVMQNKPFIIQGSLKLN